MLTREELISLAVDDYFIGCNKHNHAQVMSTMSNDCLMHFPAARFRYEGHAALSTHFEDFLGNFKDIKFHNFTNITDSETQSIVSYFNIDLIDHDGAEIKMKNCNIFHCDDQGLFNEIIIYNTQALDKGFQEGNS
ncbi:MAG: nuclear transport factor 2 family protein [Acidiferrobacterales bacterium]|nr:nuclear transport factor 2 family protein [Acidiferrobacterales bacterium]